ncbi:hypothetical protein Taro_027384 [Colocasia esculenta]|uniref:Uncharacterized protein n=1 Tax=Colocasia esculenta TaxID=4460 RepID=A0A843VMC3_COLES|nr:hypothetical protein [Colocasia esculenta]
MEWLDMQPPVSVVYVSFGTTSSLPEQQIMELAHGLERSQKHFMWVLREANRVDIFVGDDDGRQKLSDGYEHRVAGVGLVVGVTTRLALPCCISFFRQVLELLDLDEDRFKGLDLEGFLEVGYLCEAESPNLFSCRDELGASNGYNGFSPLLTKAGV